MGIPRLLASSLLVGILSLFHAPSYTGMVDRVSSSLVRVTGEKSEETIFGEQKFHYTCSGEVIARNRVLTAGHCAGQSMLADGTPATVLKVDPYYDLALLVTITDKPAIEFRDATVVRYEDLTAIGYAFGFTRLTALSVRAVLIDMSPADEMPPGLMVQFEYIGGMSGGPVVDSKGRMVAIIQQGRESVGYGVGTLLIKAFLLGTN